MSEINQEQINTNVPSKVETVDVDKTIGEAALSLANSINEITKERVSFIEDLAEHIILYINHKHNKVEEAIEQSFERVREEIINKQNDCSQLEQELNKCESSVQNLHASLYGLLNRFGKLCDSIGYDIREEIRKETFTHPLIGSIYLVKATGTDRYKVGLTIRNVEERFKELNSSQSPYPLELIHFIKVEDVATAEKHFHKLFEANKVHGEWFVFGNIDYVINLMNDYQPIQEI